MKRSIALLLVLQLVVLSISARQDIRLLITDTAGPVINRNIYGQFAEHLGRCVYYGLFRNGQILTSERFTDINTFSQPEKVRPVVFNGAKKQGGELVVALPPKSVVVLELK